MAYLRHYRKAIFAAIAGLIITLLLTVFLYQRDNERIRGEIDSELFDLQLEIRREIQSHMFGFTWITRQHQNGDENDNGQTTSWLGSGELITSYYQQLRMLFWVNREGIIEHGYPERATESYIGRAFPDSATQWLPQFQTGMRYLLPAHELGEHPADVLLVIPQLSSEPSGYYVSLLDMERLLHTTVATRITENSQFRIVRDSDSQPVFNFSAETRHYQDWHASRDFQLFGETWAMELWPSALRLSDMRSNMPLFVFISGIAISGLLTFILYLLAISRSREETLSITNKELSAEMEERERVEKRMAYLAEHDWLTDLANRNKILEYLGEILQKEGGTRKRSHAAVLILDIDHFKEVNDTLGHSVGDALLKKIGERLTKLQPNNSLLARLGGDEFAIAFVSNMSKSSLEALAKDIIRSLDDKFYVDEYEIFITVSIGISTGQKGKIRADELLANADTALYRAKDLGRNTFHMYTDELRDQLTQRIDLIKRLRTAIDKRELQVYYQPQVDMHTRRIVGAEALIRWIEDGKPVAGPDEFIPLAEDSGLIMQIGDFVLQSASKQLGHWHQMGFDDLKMSVNISGRQFQSHDLVDKINFAIKSSGVSPKNFELELTEQVFIENSESQADFMTTMTQRGVTLAIDDFGVGYSSLSYLKHFPVNVLKIDRSFVQDIPDDKDDATITQTIINLAQSLDLAIVAEGVETEEQVDFLVSRGCIVAQGYLYSRPLPAEELTELLTTHGGFIPA